MHFFILGVVGIFFAYSPDNTFFTAYTLFFCERFFSFRAMVLGTKLYQKHLKSFNERRALTKKAKISILTFSTTMLLIAFILPQALWVERSLPF